MTEHSPFPHRVVCVTQSLADFGLKAGDNGKLVRLDGSRIKTHADSGTGSTDSDRVNACLAAAISQLNPGARG